MERTGTKHRNELLYTVTDHSGRTFAAGSGVLDPSCRNCFVFIENFCPNIRM